MIGDRSIPIAIFAAMIFSVILLALSGCAMRFPVGEYGAITLGYEPSEKAMNAIGLGGYTPATLRDK
jgi:hypothetical protein